MIHTALPLALALTLVAGCATLPASSATAPTFQAASDPLVGIAHPGLRELSADFTDHERRFDPDTAAELDGRTPDRFGDVRPETLTAKSTAETALLRRAEALAQQVGPDDRLTLAILTDILSMRVLRAPLDEARVPFIADSGFHTAPLYGPARVRPRSVADVEAVIAALEDVPRYFAENIANMRRGIAAGVTAHRQVTENVLAQVADLADDAPAMSPLAGPFARLPTGLAEAEAAVLTTRGQAAVARAIAAYGEVKVFLEAEYLPAARLTPGIASVPQGRAWYAAVARYHTGTDLSPDEIHALGQSEVTRIRGLMQQVIAETGFQGDFATFLQFLRTDPQFYAKTPQELLDVAARHAKRIDAGMPRLFGRHPRLPFTIEPVPEAIAPGYTTARYVPGDLAQARAGAYWVNTWRLDQRPLFEMPALTAHEANPGHHFQIALSQELGAQPWFRKQYGPTAFVEGWGLYAETLGEDLGIYTTPYERFGRLSYEMWRACRLVADTGLHWLGWSREQAEACFRENSALAPHNITTEVTRYIGWPGQALAYKVGELELRRLRADAETRLGDRFDIRAFHDHLLAEGAVPLSELSTRMQAWVEGR